MWRLLFLVVFGMADAEIIYSQSGTTLTIHTSEIQLGQLDGKDQIIYYDLIPPYKSPKMSIGLFGHIYMPDDPNSRYLTLPVLRLERRPLIDTAGDWFQVAEAHSPGREIQISRIQNAEINPNYQYRMGVGTEARSGGLYALVVDPSMEELEFEVEDLDFGEETNHQKHAISAAYCVREPASPYGERVVAGTENGYILTSDDDAKTWQQIYPPSGELPLHGTVFGLFVDSQGNIYASPWTDADQYTRKGYHGFVIESRDGGKTWNKVITTNWPTGVAWRFAEDREGNVFIGEYSAKIVEDNAPRYPGTIWRRVNHGNQGELFETVFENPTQLPDTMLNHVHYVGVDPYTDDVYAAIGDGAVGRFIRSRQHGNPGTWETLEQGVDSQYTACAFTSQYLLLGQDTDRKFKKIIRWDKTQNNDPPDDSFWTSSGMDRYPNPPIPWDDKGNWFWAHNIAEKVIVFQYMPYSDKLMSNGQMQAPRMYATANLGETWWRAITFPPAPIRNVPRWGENGSKFSSNISPSGWIYAMKGTVTQEIHRGFRFRLKSTKTSEVDERWEYLK